jgi:hypothetical protein
MKSPADKRPPEIARQIHPDWRKNEADYGIVRVQLLSQYQGQWIGFADGKVIATEPVPVGEVASQRRGPCGKIRGWTGGLAEGSGARRTAG